MEFIITYFDYVLHIDDTISYIIDRLGIWVYAILFGIIFAETGLLVFSFLPGDSLLFASGAFAGSEGNLNIWILAVGFFLAAASGDLLNFKFGYFIGSHIPQDSFAGRVVSQQRLDKAHAFFAKYGAITIIAARFMPVFRALIPFLAGASNMPLRQFMTYNMIGALIWGVGCTLIGFWFGNIPWVQDNFTIVLILIMLTTLLPPLFTVLRIKLKRWPASPR